MTDLPKAFDWLSHNFYPQSQRNKELKIDSSYSSWEEILFEVPQGSITERFLFNIFSVWSILFNGWNRLCKLCEWQHTFIGDSIEDNINSLETDLINIFKCFAGNQIKSLYQRKWKYHY